MKKNIWRILFWGIILLLCMTLGIVGFLENRRINEAAEIVLNDLNNIVKNSYILDKYDLPNVEITSNVKGNELIITYSGSRENNYTYTLKDNILTTSYDASDNIGRDILIAVTDSIAVLNGEESGNVYELFQTSTINNYKINEGIEISTNASLVEVTLNINIAVIPYSEEPEISYFLYEDFSEDDKTNYNLIKSKNNLILIRQSEFEFSLAENNQLTSDLEESLKNIIIYFYGTDYSNRLSNVDFTNKTNYSDEKIEVTFNPEKNTIEQTNIDENYEFVRIKIINE